MPRKGKLSSPATRPGLAPRGCTLPRAAAQPGTTPSPLPVPPSTSAQQEKHHEGHGLSVLWDPR